LEETIVKNINNLSPIEAVVFESDGNKLVLTEGMKVSLITDGLELDKEITCMINYVTVDEIAYNDGKHLINVAWEYVEEISVVK
jgi:phage gp45-like